MHPHQASDKFFDLFDSCQHYLDSIRFELMQLRKCNNPDKQYSIIKEHVDHLQRCSFEFASIAINEVFYDFSARIDLDSSDRNFLESLAILLKELDPAYNDFFQNLRGTQSLNGSGYYNQKHNKRDIL